MWVIKFKVFINKSLNFHDKLQEEEAEETGRTAADPRAAETSTSEAQSGATANTSTSSMAGSTWRRNSSPS